MLLKSIARKDAKTGIHSLLTNTIELTIVTEVDHRVSFISCKDILEEELSNSTSSPSTKPIGIK